MEQYNLFLNKINEYYKYDEVVSNGSIINAYDLFNILAMSMKELHNLIYEKKELISLIENYYIKMNLWQTILGKLRKKTTPKVDFILQRFENNQASIYIRFYPATCESINYTSISICKDYGTKELYFDQLYGVDKDFAEYFKELFLHNLEILEEYYNLFKLTITNIKEIPNGCDDITETIEDDFLSLKIAYDDYGNISKKISIVKSVDPDNIFNRTWLDHESLSEYVKKNEDELLKRIPINIFDLKETTQALITKYYANNNIQNKKRELK